METNIVQAATYQKTGYDQQTKHRTFKANDPVWLLIPCQGKLSSKWQGGWTVRAVKSAVSIQICNEKGYGKVVHVNRLQHRLQPLDTVTSNPTQNVTKPWNPPQIHHTIIDMNLLQDSQASQRRYPLHHRQPPDRLQL